MSNVTPLRRTALHAVPPLAVPATGHPRVVGLLRAPARVFASFDVEFRSGDLFISYSYWEGGAHRESGVRFRHVQAFQRRAGIYSTSWHLQAYDRVLEIVDSPWAEDLREAAAQPWRDRWVLRHFLLYIDGEGAFEALAEDVEFLPDVEI